MKSSGSPWLNHMIDDVTTGRFRETIDVLLLSLWIVVGGKRDSNLLMGEDLAWTITTRVRVI